MPKEPRKRRKRHTKSAAEYQTLSREQELRPDEGPSSGPSWIVPRPTAKQLNPESTVSLRRSRTEGAISEPSMNSSRSGSRVGMIRRERRIWTQMRVRPCWVFPFSLLFGELSQLNVWMHERPAVRRQENSPDDSFARDIWQGA
jgi:hypothetical protein